MVYICYATCEIRLGGIWRLLAISCSVGSAQPPAIELTANSHRSAHSGKLGQPSIKACSANDPRWEARIVPGHVVVPVIAPVWPDTWALSSLEGYPAYAPYTSATTIP